MLLIVAAAVSLLVRSDVAAQRQKFIEAAGGVRKFTHAYGKEEAREVNRAFWDYWMDADPVLALYVEESDLAGAPEELRHCLYTDRIRECRMGSVEHIVPKSWTRDAIEDDSTRYGAETNVLNWLPTLSGVNSDRGNLRFETDDDAVATTKRSRERGSGSGTISITGEFDAEGEWIPPVADRGQIARAVLYMHLVYGLSSVLKRQEIDRYRVWSLADPPVDWEEEYNRWARSTYHISNPFTSEPGVWEVNGELWEEEEEEL